MMQIRQVRSGLDLGRSAVVDTLATALSTGPVAPWLMPDPCGRHEAFRRYTDVVISHAIVFGIVETTVDHRGALVSYSLPESADSSRAQRALGAGLKAIFDDAVVHRLGVLADAIRQRRPGRCHELAFLGVRPMWQGQGIGSALLRQFHSGVDAVDSGAFLAATSPRSRDLYADHGYRVVDQFTPGDGPGLWAMWRDPLSIRVPRT